MADEADRIVEELIWLGLPIKHKDAASRRVRGFATAAAEAMREAAAEALKDPEHEPQDGEWWLIDRARKRILALPLPTGGEAASPQWRALAEERFAEIKRAQSIIDGLVAWREAVLTRLPLASLVQLAIVEHGLPPSENAPFVAVQAAEAIDAAIQAIPYAASPPTPPAEVGG